MEFIDPVFLLKVSEKFSAVLDLNEDIVLWCFYSQEFLLPINLS